MSEVSNIVSNLRGMSRSSSPSVTERTTLEKLATIALIHDQMSKTASKKYLSMAAKGLALATPAVGAGAYGYSSGKKKGKKKGRKEMYMAAAPHVYRARRQAAILEHLAKRRAASKTASRAKYLGAAALSTVPAYFGASHIGKKKGRTTGRREVAGAARRDMSRSRLRALMAARKLRMLKSRMAQTGKAKGGK